jgi:hypothetical protein
LGHHFGELDSSGTSSCDGSEKWLERKDEGVVPWSETESVSVRTLERQGMRAEEVQQKEEDDYDSDVR